MELEALVVECVAQNLMTQQEATIAFLNIGADAVNVAANDQDATGGCFIEFLSAPKKKNVWRRIFG